LNFELFIAKRLYAGGSQAYSRPVVKIAYASIALGLAMTIISVAVVIGFKNSVSSKVVGFASPLKIVPYDRNNSMEEQPLLFSDSLISSLKKIPGVTHVQITAHKAGVLKTTDQIQGVVLKGVGKDYDWSFLKESLVKGRLPGLNTPAVSKEVLISQKLSRILNLDTADYIRIWFIGNNTRARGRKLKISGIYNTSLEEFDNRYIIGDIRHIRRLNGWGKNFAGSIEVLTDNIKTVNALAYKLYTVLPFDMTVKTVFDTYPEIYNWLSLLDTNVVVILVLMILVSGITMISTLFIIIIEKTNMVGILKALGVYDNSIRKIFFYKASGIIFRGMMCGNGLALIFYFLQERYHVLRLDAASYYVNYVPVELSVGSFLLINAGAFLVLILILIIPSYTITRITPSKALRYE